MTKMVPLKEAAQLTGLSTSELGRGARAGIYPCIKVGVGRGKYLFNMDLLQAELERKALSNMQQSANKNVTPFGIRRVT